MRRGDFALSTNSTREDYRFALLDTLYKVGERLGDTAELNIHGPRRLTRDASWQLIMLIGAVQPTDNPATLLSDPQFSACRKG